MALCHRAYIKDHVGVWSNEPQSVTWNPEGRGEMVEETALKNSGAVSSRMLKLHLSLTVSSQ